MPKRIEPAVRERVMRMIAEHRSEYTTPTELARVIAARERLGVETQCVAGLCRPRWMVGFVRVSAAQSMPRSRR
jgi:hypothetical protein